MLFQNSSPKTCLLEYLIILTLLYPSSLWASMLTESCASSNGQMVQQWTCPNTGKVRTGDFCVTQDADARPMVFNGCTSSVGNYGEVFFMACVYHDFCYHHEPNSSGLVKDDCDKQFLQDMLKICRSEQPENSDCVSSAKWMYRGVEFFGDSSWQCSKESARYPRSPKST
jgi:hypothetical protein